VSERTPTTTSSVPSADLVKADDWRALEDQEVRRVEQLATGPVELEHKLSPLALYQGLREM
jgi:hypothetical protein